MLDYIRRYFGEIINSVPTYVYVALFLLLLIISILILFTKCQRPIQKYGRLLFFEYLILLLCSTIFYRPLYDVIDYKLIPFWSYYAIFNEGKKELCYEILMNIMAFIPIGFLGRMAFEKISLLRVQLIGVFISFSIEVSQFVSRKGLLEADDLINNYIGCLVGMSFYLYIVQRKSILSF